MIITADISNTGIDINAVEDGKSIFKKTLATAEPKSADEYALTLTMMAQLSGIDLRKADGAIISCVVPRLTNIFAKGLKLCTGREPIVIGPGVKSGLSIRIEDPAELGADLVAAAVGAIVSYPLPCISIDMDTATAVGVLDKNGNYIGGCICPGVMTGQISLEKGTSRLPSVSLGAPRKVISKSTADCMRSGIIYGGAAMIDGVIDRIEAELGEKATVIATGRWADNIIPYCSRKDIITDPDLIMKGLISIYKKNS